MGRVKDMAGRTFGRLTVLELDHIEKQAMWKCSCTCGSTAVVAGYDLRSGHTSSCGCLHREVTSRVHKTHGKSKTSLAYRTWVRMKIRCYDKNSPDFPLYGGRGIVVCATWKHSFEQFLADMGEPPDGTSIDRVNNNGPYAPSNCRWATTEEQSNNRSNVRLFSFEGEDLSLAQIARRVGVSYGTLRKRVLYLGWEFQQALRTPERRSL